MFVVPLLTVWSEKIWGWNSCNWRSYRIGSSNWLFIMHWHGADPWIWGPFLYLCVVLFWTICFAVFFFIFSLVYSTTQERVRNLFFNKRNLLLWCTLTSAFFAVQKELGTYLYESLLSVPNVRIYGPAPSQTDHRAPLCSFNIENVHPTDIAEILDLQVCWSFNNLVYT